MAGAAAAVKGGGALIEGAGTAMQYLGKGKKGNKTFDPDLYRNSQLFERLFQRGTEDILNEERTAVEEAVKQGALISPELYRTLGYEPIMEDRSEALAIATRKRDEIRARLTAKMGKGKGKIIGRKKLQRALRVAEAELGDLSAAPLRVIGIEKRATPPDPTGSEGGSFRTAFDLENETLRRALIGEDPLDPTLKREYEERERTLRERLRRTLGTDYETASSGIEALANFDREKAEAFAQYNRGTIKDFSAMTESRAGAISTLTGERLQQLSFPADSAAKRGLALGDVAESRVKQEELLLEQRKKQGRATLIPKDSKGLVAGGIVLETFGAAFSGGGLK